MLDEQVKPLIRQFLQERGLTLSEEKTKITHIEDGFEFLGCNIRKFKGKLLTRPSKASEKAFLAKIRAVIRANRMARQQDLIAKLNPIIQGWTNFHRFNVASKVFHHADFQIYQALWKWAKRRHHNKGGRWIAHDISTVLAIVPGHSLSNGGEQMAVQGTMPWNTRAM